MSKSPTLSYTHLMAQVNYYQQLNDQQEQRCLSLHRALDDANQACLQMAKEADQLQAKIQELGKLRTKECEFHHNKVNALEQEVRALKRQLIN